MAAKITISRHLYHINEIDKMLADGGFIVLYSEKQLEDLRSMCCTGQSILGIDKTFNLCDMHAMASCYKQTSVKMETTGEPPIFLGPIFSTLINTRVTSLYFRHIYFDTTCSLVINRSYCAHTQRNLYKTLKQCYIFPSERNFRRSDGDFGNI